VPKRKTQKAKAKTLPTLAVTASNRLVFAYRNLAVSKSKYFACHLAVSRNCKHTWATRYAALAAAVAVRACVRACACMRVCDQCPLNV